MHRKTFFFSVLPLQDACSSGVSRATQHLPSGTAMSLNTTTMGKTMAWAESWNTKFGHDWIISPQQTGRLLLAPLRAGGLFY